MEVGAVKQAFNNEVILLKKKLNQAKIQIIHKLTRKAKQLAEKKAPDPLKEKLKRKAESAVNEVLIIKKIKPKDIAQFIVTHKGELKDFLNKQQVDNDKACARLLLHKALQDKYKSIRSRFSNVPIKDLFMSRLERKKLKKEEKEKQKEKQKNKKKGKDNKVVNSEGDWNVEDVDIGDKKLRDVSDNESELSDGDERPDEDNSQSEEENASEKDESEQDQVESEQSEAESVDNDEEISVERADVSASEEENLAESVDEHSEPESEEPSEPEESVFKSQPILPKKQEILTKDKPLQKEVNNKPIVNKKKPEKKQKDVNKNKNFNEKIQQRKFKKDSDAPVAGNKMVDPFFITSTGENYLSVVEPRGPDEVKEEHRHGNRKLRRAAMFGHVPKIKPRYQNNYDDNKFGKQNGNDQGNNFRSKFNNKDFNDRKGLNNDFNDRKSFNNGFNDRKGFNNSSSDRKRFNDKADEKPEKLHPSWEAKKKKSGILPFEGKKIVFD